MTLMTWAPQGPGPFRGQTMGQSWNETTMQLLNNSIWKQVSRREIYKSFDIDQLMNELFSIFGGEIKIYYASEVNVSTVQKINGVEIS